MVRINKLFCGCTLETGTLFLLWTTLILCCCSMVTDVYRMVDEPQILPQEYSWDDFKEFVALTYKISVLVISIAGLYGIIKNKPQLLVIFYYFNYFQLLLISVFILYLFLDPIKTSKSLLPETTQFDDQTKAMVLTLFLLFGLAFQIYLTVVVKSYYEMMKEGSMSSRSHILVFTYPEYYNYGFI